MEFVFVHQFELANLQSIARGAASLNWAAPGPCQRIKPR